MSFARGTTLTEAQEITDEANEVAATILGEDFEQASYYGLANEHGAAMIVDLLPYSKRDVRLPELIEQVEETFEGIGRVKVKQIDAGPPASPFTVQIEATDRAAAFALATDVGHS